MINKYYLRKQVEIFLDKIKDSISINIDSISSEELLEIIKYIESEKVLDISNIEEIDKIIITPVFCYNGPQKPLIIKKDEYPQFDDLLSKLKIKARHHNRSYTIIELYKGTELIVKGYFDYSNKIKEMRDAINQAKEWFKKKQKL